MPTRLRLGILGSCVSRDMAALHRECSVIVYVARQSLVSAVSPAAGVEPGELASAFQRRMLESDLASTGLDLLEQHARELDLVVIDLVDERLGLVPLPDGGYVTDSQELKTSGTKSQLSVAGDDIEFGTDVHFRLWSEAAQRVVDRLRRAELLDRTVVLRTPFADHTNDGVSVAPFMGRDARAWDALYDRYFARLHELGLTVAALPHELATSDPAHRWGPAPYHYNPDAYAWLMSAARRSRQLDDEPVDGPLARRHVRMPLSLPVAGITNPATAGTVRFPVALSTDERRWRLRVRNHDERTGRSSRGRVEVTGLWFGSDAGDGAFASEPTRLMGARTVPSGGRELVTPWFDRPLSAGQWLISLGWIAESNRSVVVSLVDTHRTADPADAGRVAPSTVSASRYAPLSWAIELEVPETVPVLVGWGDERLLSSTAGAEIASSPLSRAASAMGGVPVHVVQPGTALGLWLGYRSQWAEARLPYPATAVYHAMGMRDVLSGSSADELRTMYAESLERTHRAWGDAVIAVLLDEAAAVHSDVARDVNRWLLETHPGPVVRLSAGNFECVRGELPAGPRAVGA